MEVTKQTNPNECGVCVISSLVKHFYHQDNKQVILNDANISGDGLSIFNFEHLAQQYGIFVETFQLDWQEFISLKNNDYMVCPIKKNGGLHYVIVKKHKYELDIYDSTDGKYRVNIREFAKSFCGIIMMIGKMSRRINISSLPKLDL
jgi:ABC-type bacteriocin/lantibiotic exporter with double-glycine peptidase domain